MLHHAYKNHSAMVVNFQAKESIVVADQFLAASLCKNVDLGGTEDNCCSEITQQNCFVISSNYLYCISGFKKDPVDRQETFQLNCLQTTEELRESAFHYAQFAWDLTIFVAYIPLK
uniref:AlNc14C393G11301 protein n=1 Tax=Albugo laibachii Nc14 TaxID=890382 RepID=F0WYN8_9STRA|nr:AlNc14C393G11301 [Albugo laibachii Nc14]|eukprot:CCA26597.1 AlNc14C393G11301 [Albugo laibachii Nc14]